MLQNQNNILKLQLETACRTVRQQQKARTLGIKLLLAHIDRNIRNLEQSYNQCLESIKEQIYGVQNIYDRERVFLEVKEQLGIFIKEIGQCPGIWMEMLEKNQISKQENKIVLNGQLVISEVFEVIATQTSEKIRKLRKYEQNHQIQQTAKSKDQKIDQFDFQESYCDQTMYNLLSLILNFFAEQIAECFQKCKEFITKKTKQVEQLIKNSQIMNSYILFALLKQLSRESHNFIVTKFMINFPGVDKKDCQKFCRFVQTNYEILQLQCSSDETRILTAEQKKQIIQKNNSQLLNTILELSQSNDLIEKKQNQENIASELIGEVMQKSETENKNKKWKILDVKKSMSQLFHSVGKNIQGQIKAKPNQKIQNDLMLMAPKSASLGGSLGKCLVDIDQYEDVNDFFADLSKTAMIGGSITILLEEIPILNYFIIAGGLSYSVYKAYNDEITSSVKKMKQVGKASIIAVGSVGSTVTGMMVGGIIIPIPFVGAFIGGVVGGFLGEKGSRQLTSILNNKSLIKLINYLHQSIVDDSNWVYSKELLSKLGISQEYFEQSFCTESSERSIKITGACFCIVSFYESRKQIQHTKKKLNEKEGKYNEKKQKIKQVFLKKQDFFVSEFNIVAIVTHLMSNKVSLIDQLPQFQKLVRHLIS